MPSPSVSTPPSAPSPGMTHKLPDTEV
jgi:hypothetical protein